MAEKFAAGDALTETFRFALNRWFTVLRLGWAPMLMVGLIIIAMTMLIFDFEVLKAAEDDPEFLLNFDEYLKVSVPVAISLGVLVSILISLIMAGFMASVFRLVSLGEGQPGFVHIRFDGPAFRVFFAQIILTVINYGILFGGMLIGSMITGISLGAAFGSISEMFRIIAEASANGSEPTPESLGEAVAPIGLFFIGFLIAAIPMIIINIRLAPFVAGSAAENRLLLAGSFALTKGNFWSLFGYYLLFMLSLMVVYIIFSIVIGIVDLIASLPNEGAFALLAMGATVISLLLSVAYQIFTIALQLGSQGIIYRRLKTGA